MDLGITNIFIFYLRSWLILSIEISPPFFAHRLTLAIYLTAPIWVNQYKRNREFGQIYSSKFHDTFHVSKNLIKTLYYYSVSKSLIALYSTPYKDTPPMSSSGHAHCRCLGRRVLTPSPWREFHPRDQSWVPQEKPPICAHNLRCTEGALRRLMCVK